MVPATALESDVPGIEKLFDIVSSRRLAVLTGAGVSTDSGIPDYRGQGSSKRTPMNISDFVSSASARQRYWAGAHVGWRSFSAASPNAGHLALAAMEQAGIIEGIVSQNVDGLHRRAGNSHVIDLHGSLDRVICLECSQAYDRSAVESRLSELNPWLNGVSEIVLAPDGDVNVTDFRNVIVPECTVCGGILKPDVVFFGELVPLKIYQAATSHVKRADCLLVAGSSLAVNSGIRLIDIARKKRMPIIIVNRGETKGDKFADLKIDAGTSEVLQSLASALGAHLYEDIE